MALCLECKADYLPHITVCPACNRALERETSPRPAESVGFVPFLTTGYPEGLVAAASLEAAGLETRLSTMDFHVYMATPMSVTVLVRERDLDAARAALHAPAAPVPPVRAVEPIPENAPPCESPETDEDVRDAVHALNQRKGVRTVCSCSGSHEGARGGYISISPSEDVDAVALFDAFVDRLQKRVEASELAGRLTVHWSAVHGAEITLLDRSGARETWGAFARLISRLP